MRYCEISEPEGYQFGALILYFLACFLFMDEILRFCVYAPGHTHGCFYDVETDWNGFAGFKRRLAKSLVL